MVCIYFVFIVIPLWFQKEFNVILCKSSACLKLFLRSTSLKLFLRGELKPYKQRKFTLKNRTGWHYFLITILSIMKRNRRLEPSITSTFNLVNGFKGSINNVDIEWTWNIGLLPNNQPAQIQQWYSESHIDPREKA